MSVYKSASCRSVIRSLVHGCIPNPIITLVKTPYTLSSWEKKYLSLPQWNILIKCEDETKWGQLILH